MAGRVGSLWVVLLALAVTGCATGSSGSPETLRVTSRATEAPIGAASVSEQDEVSCTTEGVPMREDASVELTRIASENGVEVYAAEYPLPGPTEGLWSQWGQGVVATNGLHYSGVGDHLGADGNSHLFEYDPNSRRLTRFMDVLSLVDHQPGAGGYGKIHAQMVADPCGSVWLFTYWGTRRELEYGNGYEGDLLLEVDPEAGRVMNHGPVVGRRGVPSLTGTQGARYLVGEAVHPETGDGDLVVFDTTAGDVTHRLDDPRHDGFRSLAVDAKERVLFSVGDGELRALDPASGDDTDVELVVPSSGDDFLRAATPVTQAGVFYGVMQESRTFFSVDDSGKVTTLAPAGGYTTSIAIPPEGDSLYWLPNAHGAAWEDGAVVRSVDTASGEVDEVVALREPFEEHLGLLPGGTYSIVYHEGRLILGVNASPLDDDSGFGAVVMVVIEGL